MTIFDFIEGWYNLHRHDSGLDYDSRFNTARRHETRFRRVQLKTAFEDARSDTISLSRDLHAKANPRFSASRKSHRNTRTIHSSRGRS